MENPELNADTGLPIQMSYFFGDESIWNIVAVHCRDIFNPRFGQNTISEPLAWAISNQLWDIQQTTMPYEDKLDTYSIIIFDGDETPLAREMLRRYPQSHLTNLNLKNWSAVRDTNRLFDLSPEIIRHFDQKIFDHIVTNVKKFIELGSPSQARFFIQDLYFYPSAEVINLLVRLSVFGLDEEADTANITLTDLARRNDWQAILGNLLETYPKMAIVAKDLANFEFVERCNYPISPALKKRLASATGFKYHYDQRLGLSKGKSG